MNIDKEREAFERYAIDRGFNLQDDADGSYKHIEHHRMWQAWQARAEYKPLTVEQIVKIIEDLSNQPGQHSYQDVARAIHAAIPTSDEKDRRIAELTEEITARKRDQRFHLDACNAYCNKIAALECKIAGAIEVLKKQVKGEDTAQAMLDDIDEDVEILEATK